MQTLSPKKLTKIVLTGVVCAAVASGVAGYVWYENQRPPLLEIYVFALKSGQSIFIRTPTDKRILIDGGTNSEIIRRISSVLPFYTRRIDTIIVTKADGKHVSGLVDVLGRYSVGEVIIPGVDLVSFGLASSSDQIYETFLDTVQRVGVSVRKVMAGDDLILEKTSDVALKVLFPVASSTFQYSKASGPELVSRISYGSTSVMSAGSITTKIQRFVASSTDLKSSTKSSALVFSQNVTPSTVVPTFIENISPDYVVFSKSMTSVGSSAAAATTGSSTKKKKPKPDPLAGVPEDHRFNVRESGTLKIVSDGKSLEIKSHD